VDSFIQFKTTIETVPVAHTRLLTAGISFEGDMCCNAWEVSSGWNDL